MIPRYSTPEMDAVWSDTSKFARWLEVELLATVGHAAVGVVPQEAATICRANAPVADAQISKHQRNLTNPTSLLCLGQNVTPRNAKRRAKTLLTLAYQSTPFGANFD